MRNIREFLRGIERDRNRLARIEIEVGRNFGVALFEVLQYLAVELLGNRGAFAVQNEMRARRPHLRVLYALFSFRLLDELLELRAGTQRERLAVVAIRLRRAFE